MKFARNYVNCFHSEISIPPSARTTLIGKYTAVTVGPYDENYEHQSIDSNGQCLRIHFIDRSSEVIIDLIS